MDAQRGWNKDNESKELTLLEQVEAKQKEIDASSAKIAELELATADESARVEKEVAELNVSQDELLRKRETLTPHVPDKELAIYTRIVATRGTAISYVSGVNCSACYLRLPAQFVNLAMLGKELVTCPSCGRILTTMPKT
jgi:predicted  nucleic acid-binding Zn-ribbon protein